MKGYINIIGEIGFGATELKHVVTQVQQQPHATEFDVIINSGGGSVKTGFEIYDYLKSLGKPITTIGVGVVASIATIIFSAGDRRILKSNTQMMIHLPWGGVEGTTEEIEAYAKELKAAQTKIADFFKTTYNLTDEAINPLLQDETWFTAEEAKNIGFATGIEHEIVAKFKIDNKMNLNNEDRSWIESMFNKILGTKKDPKNMTLTTATGQIVDFAKVEEGAMPAPGDEATIDGELADGDVLMSTNETYVFDKGVLVEIKQAEENAEEGANEEVEALKAENEALKAEIEELKEQLNEAKNEMNNKLEEIRNFKRQITSKFNPGKKEEVKNFKKPEEQQTKRKIFKD